MQIKCSTKESLLQLFSYPFSHLPKVPYEKREGKRNAGTHFTLWSPDRPACELPNATLSGSPHSPLRRAGSVTHACCRGDKDEEAEDRERKNEKGRTGRSGIALTSQCIDISSLIILSYQQQLDLVWPVMNLAQCRKQFLTLSALSALKCSHDYYFFNERPKEIKKPEPLRGLQYFLVPPSLIFSKIPSQAVCLCLMHLSLATSI